MSYGDDVGLPAGLVERRAYSPPPAASAEEEPRASSLAQQASVRRSSRQQQQGGAAARSMSPSLPRDDSGGLSPRSPSARTKAAGSPQRSIKRSRSRPSAPLPPSVQLHQDNTMYFECGHEPIYVEKSNGAPTYSVAGIFSASLGQSRGVGGDNANVFRAMAKVRDAMWVAETDGSVTVRDLDTAEVRRILEPLHDTKRKQHQGGMRVTKDSYCTRAPGHLVSLAVVAEKVWGGANDGKVHVYSFAGKREKEMKHHAGPVNAIAHNNGHVFTGSCDFKIAHWDAATLSFLRLLHGHKMAVRSLCMANDILFSGSDDRMINVWSAQWATVPGGSGNQALLRTLSGHRGDVLCIEKSRGNVWSGSTDCSIRVWDITSGDCKAVLPHHTGWVHVLRELGEKVWSASHDGSVCIWSGRNVSLLQRIDAPHQGLLHSLVLGKSTTVSRLWTVGGDQVVKFWEVAEVSREQDSEHWDELFLSRQKMLEMAKMVDDGYAKHSKLTEMLEAAHSLLVQEKMGREEAVRQADSLEHMLGQRDETIAAMVAKNDELQGQYEKMRHMSQSFRDNIQLMLQQKEQHSASPADPAFMRLLSRLKDLEDENERLSSQARHSVGGAAAPDAGREADPSAEEVHERCAELEATVARLSHQLELAGIDASNAVAPDATPAARFPPDYQGSEDGGGGGAGAAAASAATGSVGGGGEERLRELLEAAVGQLSRKCSVLRATLPHISQLQELLAHSTEGIQSTPTSALDSLRAMVEAESADMGVGHGAGGGLGSRLSVALSEDPHTPSASTAAAAGSSSLAPSDAETPAGRREARALEREVQRLRFDLDKVTTSCDIKVAQLRQHLAEREADLHDAREELASERRRIERELQDVDRRRHEVEEAAAAAAAAAAAEKEKETVNELAAQERPHGAAGGGAAAADDAPRDVAEEIHRDSLQLELAAVVAEKAIMEQENEALQETAERLKASLKHKTKEELGWRDSLSQVEDRIREKEAEHKMQIKLAQDAVTDEVAKRQDAETSLSDSTLAVAALQRELMLSLLCPGQTVELTLAAGRVERCVVAAPLTTQAPRTLAVSAVGAGAGGARTAHRLDEIHAAATVEPRAGCDGLAEHAAEQLAAIEALKKAVDAVETENKVMKLIPGTDVRLTLDDGCAVVGKVLKYSADEAVRAGGADAAVPLEVRRVGEKEVGGDVKSYGLGRIAAVESMVKDFHSFFAKIGRIHEEKDRLEEHVRGVDAEVAEMRAATQTLQDECDGLRARLGAGEASGGGGAAAGDAAAASAAATVADLRQRLADAEGVEAERCGVVEGLREELARAQAEVAALTKKVADSAAGAAQVAAAEAPAAEAASGEEVAPAAAVVPAGDASEPNAAAAALEAAAASAKHAAVAEEEVALLRDEVCELTEANEALKEKNHALKEQMSSRVKVIEEGLAAAKAAKDVGRSSAMTDAEAARLQGEAEVLRRELDSEINARESLIQEVQLLKEELSIAKNKAQQLASRLVQFEDVGRDSTHTQELTAAHQTINSLYAELQQAQAQISLLQETREKDIADLTRRLDDERATSESQRRDRATDEARSTQWTEMQDVLREVGHLRHKLQENEAEIARLTQERQEARRLAAAATADQQQLRHEPAAKQTQPPPPPPGAVSSSDLSPTHRHYHYGHTSEQRGSTLRSDDAGAGVAGAAAATATTAASPVPERRGESLTAASPPALSPLAGEALQLREEVDQARRSAAATQEAADELRFQIRQLLPTASKSHKVSVQRTIKFKSGKVVRQGATGTVMREGESAGTLRVRMDEEDVLFDFKTADIAPCSPQREASASAASPSVQQAKPATGPMVRLCEAVQTGGTEWPEGSWCHLLQQDASFCALQLIHPRGSNSSPPLFAHHVEAWRVEHVRLPAKLYVRIPHVPPADGCYTLVEGVLSENNPIWQAGHRMLCTNRHGAWIVGQTSELAQGVGWAVSKAPHLGAMPHETPVWQTFANPSEPWLDDPTVYIGEFPPMEVVQSSASSARRRPTSPSPRRTTPASGATSTLSPAKEAELAAAALSMLPQDGVKGSWHKRARSLSQHQEQRR